MDKHTKENWAKVKAALETANKTDTYFYKRAVVICTDTYAYKRAVVICTDTYVYKRAVVICDGGKDPLLESP